MTRDEDVINKLVQLSTKSWNHSPLSVLSISPTGQIQFHTATFISAEKVDITRPGLVRNNGLPQIIKAHGEEPARYLR